MTSHHQLQMPIFILSRAPLSNGKAVEMMTSHLKFCMNSFASCFEDQGLHLRGGICAARHTVATWVRNVIVLIPKKVGFERLERQVRDLLPLLGCAERGLCLVL